MSVAELTDYFIRIVLTRIYEKKNVVKISIIRKSSAVQRYSPLHPTSEKINCLIIARVNDFRIPDFVFLIVETSWQVPMFFPFLLILFAHMIGGCIAEFKNQLTTLLDGNNSAESVIALRAQIARFEPLSRGVACYGDMFAGYLAGLMGLVGAIVLIESCEMMHHYCI